MFNTAGKHVALEARTASDADASILATGASDLDLRPPVGNGSSAAGVQTESGDNMTCGYGTIADLVASNLELSPDAASRGVLFRAAKRAMDLAIGLPSLMLIAPVIALLALLIRLDSPGPAIFKQHRVGLNGELIRFYKFRTMYVDAKERFPELYEYKYTADQLEHAYYKGQVDPRNTRMGGWLRKTTLDELPNLINVVLGNVSLVGPRPELKEMVRYYRPVELSKFTVKSGITGLAQCTGRNNLTVRQQIAADVRYVEDQSLWLDTKILFLTAWSVLRSEGAI